jgi:glycosyltransferase involved in cell wall biosynthesis
MRLVSLIEQRFQRTPDGVVWTDGQFPRSYWDRHLEIFDSVCVVARVGDVTEPPAGALHAEGDGVSISPIPYYQGPSEYMRVALGVRRAVHRSVTLDDAVTLRIGSQIANLLDPHLRRTGHPYGVEVVTDPYNVFAPMAVEHPLRPLFRLWFTFAARRQCANASALAYVTEFTLQKHYPPPKGGFTTYYSDGDMPPEAFVQSIIRRPLNSPRIHLVSTGSLAQMYKSPDVVIKALAQCVSEGLEVHLTWIGDGKYRTRMEKLAEELMVRNRVEFKGQLSTPANVRAVLDTADLYVLASRTEGLPRSLIEAMARGLPCIATSVGGIPELLAPDDLVPADNVSALADMIRAMASNPARLEACAGRNLAKAHEYETQALRPRQYAYLRALREKTEEWQRTRHAARPLTTGPNLGLTED